MYCLNKIIGAFSLSVLHLFLIVNPIYAQNLISNGDFSTGLSLWNTFTNGNVSFGSQQGYSVVTVSNYGTNSQLYQSGFRLKPNVEYRLNLKAKSSRPGTKINVLIHQQNAPNTNYGLSKEVTLSTEFQNFTYTFTSSGFSSETTDTRLRFWFVNSSILSGDTITIDQVSLEESSNVQQPSTPTNTANLIINGDFASNSFANWSTFTENSNVVFSSSGGSANTTINQPNNNAQINQVGFSLKPNTQYTVKFVAQANRVTTPLTVAVIKNTSPYSSLGFYKTYLLTTQMTEYEDIFVTSGISTNTADTRLMFYFVNADLRSGDIITFDNVSLEEGDTRDAPTLGVTPTPQDPTPTPNSTPPIPTIEPPVVGGALNKYDLNADGQVNILDVIDIIKYVFSS